MVNEFNSKLLKVKTAQIIDTAPLVLDIGVVLLLAASLGLLARKLGLPAIIGYLLTGLLVSPFTPGYVAGSEQLLGLSLKLGNGSSEQVGAPVVLACEEGSVLVSQAGERLEILASDAAF